MTELREFYCWLVLCHNRAHEDEVISELLVLLAAVALIPKFDRTQQDVCITNIKFTLFIQRLTISGCSLVVELLPRVNFHEIPTLKLLGSGENIG